MTEHEERDQQEEQGDELAVPDETVEDLEPSEEEGGDVGGGFKRGWPSK